MKRAKTDQLVHAITLGARLDLGRCFYNIDLRVHQKWATYSYNHK